MTDRALTEEERSAIDGALAAWRQGDVVLDEGFPFVHVGDPSRPLTLAAREADGDGPTALEGQTEGLVVLTQTCDIVRGCIDRPYIEVAPLVEVEANLHESISRGDRPNYAVVASLRERRLVADLDRTMTVEKSIVAGWKRTEGPTSDATARSFARALGRKRTRPAFPDDFVHAVGELQKRIKSKHDKNSAEGMLLQSLREIRVTAIDGWDAPEVMLFFWFVRGLVDKGADLSAPVEAWMKLFKLGGRFTEVAGVAVTLDQMKARDYVESDALDLDYLSQRGAPAPK